MLRVFVQMPMMHRVSVFRDDVIFVIYMFQRWKYPVDKSRPAEGFEDAADGAAPPSSKPSESAATASGTGSVDESTVTTSPGLSHGEGGEVANEVKKIYRDDAGFVTEDRRAKIADELGDVLWYVAELAHQIGWTLEEIGQQNLDKLANR